MVGLVIRANSAAGIFPVGETFDYYIGPSGSDSNPGTLAQPWAISSINNSTKRSLYAGKSIGLLDGTYGLVDYFGTPSSLTWSDNVIKVKGGPNSSTPTILKSVTRHGAIIHGQRSSMSSTAGQGGLLGPLDDNVILDGMKIANANYSAISNFNCDHFTAKNFWIDDQVAQQANFDNSAAILLRQVRNCLLRNFKITNSNGGPSNRHDNVLLYCDGTGDSVDFAMEYFFIEGGGNGFYAKWAGNSNRNLRLGNGCIDRATNPAPGTNYGILLSGSASAADYLRMHGLIVDGGTGRPTLLLIQQGHAGELSASNCTWVSESGTTEGMAVLTIDANTFDPSLINYFNNIHHRAGIGFNNDLRVTSVAALNDLDYNCYDSNPAVSLVIAGGAGAGTYSSLAAWRTATGKEANSITTTNPLFVGSGTFAQRYALQEGSPAKIPGLNGATELGAYGDPTYDGLGKGYSDARS